MQYYIRYDLVALTFAIMILADHVATYKQRTRSNIRFRMLAVCDVIVIIMDIADTYSRMRPVHPENGIRTLLSALLCFGCALFFCIACSYFEAIIIHEGESTKIGRYAVFTLVVQTLILFVNQFSGCCFSYAEEGLVRGPLFVFNSIYNVLFILIMCIGVLKHQNCFSRSSIAPMCILLILIILSNIIQNRMFPLFSTTGYITSLCLMTIMFTLERSESEKLMQTLSEYNENLKTLIRTKSQAFSDTQDSIINAMADIIAGKEGNCEKHSARTSAIVEMITDKMNRDPSVHKTSQYYNCIVKTAPLCDIGRITLSDRILNAEEPLTKEDVRQYQAHTIAGATAIHRIFKDSNMPELVNVAENIARSHHENYDGSGYPDGLKGEEIPLEARIVSIASAFDIYMAQTEKKNRDDVAAALKMIWDNMNSLYDPSLVRFLFASREEICSYYEKQFSGTCGEEAIQ